MTKLSTKILNILTFGTLSKKAINKMNKIEQNQNSKYHSQKTIIDIDQLLLFIGGKTNIISISSTINCLKIQVNKLELVDREKIKKISKKGIMFSNNSISIIVGNSASNLVLEIEKLI